MTVIIISTIVYVTVLMLVGILGFRKVHTLNEFCIGARISSASEVGLSGQLSELGYFIFIMIPAGVYLSGLGKAWTMIGLFVGTMFIWYLMSYRLMRYSLKYKNVYSVPDYFGRRFGRGDFLPVNTAMISIVFDLVIAAALVKLLAIFVADITGMDTGLLSAIIVTIVLGFIMLSGYKGSVHMDKINAWIVIAALVTLPIVTMFIFKADELIIAIMNSRVSGGASRYLNAFRIGGRMISPFEIVNQLSWGLVIMGMPGLMIRFLSIGKARTAKHGGRHAILFTLLALFFTVVSGVLYRAFLYPMILKNLNNQYFLSKAVTKLLKMKLGYKISGGVLFAGLLAVFVSMIVNAIHNACIVSYCTIMRPRVLRKFRIKKNIKALRITAFVTAGAVFGLSFIDIDPMLIIESSIIVVAAAFGPCVMLSLYSKRMNKYGASAGMITGALFAFLWRFGSFFKDGGETIDMEELTGLSPILPAFVLSTLVIIIVSYLTPDVSEEIKKDYDDVKNRIM